MIYDNLIYNKTILDQFKQHVDGNSIPNAFILHGNEGSGKFGHAIELAYIILSKKADDKTKLLNKIKKNLHENINYILPLPRKKALSKTDSALKALRIIDIENISFNIEPQGSFSNRWLTTILLDENSTIDAKQLRLHLERDNIESRHLWKPMHLQPIFRRHKCFGGSVSEDLFNRGLCLPSGSNLNQKDLNRIVENIKRLYEK